MADAVAYLISARASLQNVLSGSSYDPHAVWILASVYGKVGEALSVLDDLNVSQSVENGSNAGVGHSLAHSPAESSRWSPMSADLLRSTKGPSQIAHRFH